MDKIAIIIPRYGKDINGGLELHAFLIADHLKDKYEFTILTTCLNDQNGKNNYPAGESIIDGIRVIRFESETTDIKVHDKAFRYLHKSRIYSGEKFRLNNFFSLLIKKIKYRPRKTQDLLFEQWIENQEPHCTKLIDYIRKNKDEYTSFIFFGYLYYLSYKGMLEVGEKSILIPIAHNEATLYFNGFDKTFSLPRFIMYNSLAEKQLVESLHTEAKHIKYDIAGVGFDKPVIDIEYNKDKIIDYPYFIYIGRIHEHKGCKEMIEYFEYFKQTHNSNHKLVMIGKNFMPDVKPSDDIIYLGFVDDQEKVFYLQNCEALIIPSLHESLSSVTLEAMLMGKPVLANEGCEVLKAHITISKAGYTYCGKDEFSSQLNKIWHLSDENKKCIANNGNSYVEENYNWSSIVDKFVKAIQYITLKN
ncbi:glycosyltransferase family 4 protein [Dysgonomonas sp. ZJ709]|uniref:glycosyltransferase family 4 protein n=1 Tax=Dysgonomonas sp. ZJ709 TaxID=2709797 RepID=UPI0013EDF737|nr:glycosyltransferase family 4 protein [Dysgonomonas sp. ZJ709]